MIKVIVPLTLLKKSETEDVVLDVSDHWRLAEAACEVADALAMFGHPGLDGLAKKLRDALIAAEDVPAVEIPDITPEEEAKVAAAVKEAMEEAGSGVSLIDVLGLAEAAEDAGQYHLSGDLYLAIGAEIRRRINRLGALAEPD